MLESDDPREALDGFKQVVAMEQDKGEWCARVVALQPGPEDASLASQS